MSALINKIFFVTLIVFLVSCSSDKPNHYKLLSEKEMIYFLTRLHVSEAISQNQGYNSIDSARMFHYFTFTPLLKAKGYELSDFDSSFVYYSRKPKVLDALYQKAIDSLAVREAMANIKIED